MSKRDIKALRQRRADLKKRGLEANDELNKLLAKSDLSAEENARMQALEAECDKIEADLKAVDQDIEAEDRRARRASLFAPSPAGNTTVNDPNPQTTGGFRSLSEFAVAVRGVVTGGGLDARLNASTPSNFHQNQGGSGEGFLVPTEFRQQIWELVFGAGDLLSRVDTEPTTSNAVGVIRDETTPWGASGVQAAWRAEASQMTPSKHALTGALMQLHELYAFVSASDELLQDAPRLQNRLTVKAAEAIRWKASDAIMWGDGNGKPLGFMNAGALVSVAKEAGQAAATLNTKNISKMFSRLLPQGMGRAFWLANSDILPQLMELTIGNQPIWTAPQQGFQDAPGGFLLGKPILYTEHAQTLGVKGDLTLVDGMGYAAATKAGGIDFATSIHLWFDYGLQAFRWTFRFGGQPYLSGPVSPNKGAATKSHFVALDTRA